ARLVEDERRIRGIPQYGVHFAGELVDQRLVRPRRRADELLHALIVAVDDIVLDGFDVLAPLGAHQAREVTAGVMDAVHPLLDEVRGVAVAELHEASCHSAQGAGVIFFYFAEPGKGVRSWFLVRKAYWLARA